MHGEMQEVFSTFEVRIQEEGDGDFQKKKTENTTRAKRSGRKLRKTC